MFGRMVLESKTNGKIIKYIKIYKNDEIWLRVYLFIKL